MPNLPTNNQIEEVKNRLQHFLITLDQIEPETTDLQEIDRLIGMIDDLEEQMEKIKTDK
ncbi:SE1561 family protein [Sporosarcina sp. 179-K 3D1 HS]|uniref:SE1561 family protein n=1 Tax=Sporosarcina sp. 179-K 3D1 HS TaxID=3232169 RepID=UPI0039A12475